MKNLYIHAGFGKCGSSSIQAFLSGCEKLKCENGDSIVYAALSNDHRIIYGKELTKQASQCISGYRSSLPFYKMKPSPEDYFNMVGEQLLELLQKSHVLISHESWSMNIKAWDQISFFRKSNITVTFIFYIRPPVLRINSAWWQWGAWLNQDLDVWLKQSIEAVNYGKIIKEFNNLNWVNQIRVRLLDYDLLNDFSSVLGLDKQGYQQQLQAASNKSLPNGILRLFQAHRRLRTGPHDSQIEFVLEKYLKLDGKADWVLNSGHIKKIIEQTRDSNLLLLNLIDEDCKAKFLADQRYWDPATFDGIPTKPAIGLKPTYDELEGIALAGIDAVMDLAAQRAAMKTNINPDQFFIWRDLALYVEKSDIELAYRLMQQASKARPDGKFIQKKLATYKIQLDKLKNENLERSGGVR